MKWKPVVGWGAAAIAVLVFVSMVGGLLFLKSRAFQNLAVRKIREQTQSATGARTEIGGADFSFSPITAHLYDITVHGTEDSNQPPLLHIDKLTIGIKIQSLLHRQFSLRELLVEHPEVYVKSSRWGETNLPHAPASQGKSQTSIFDLAVAHAQITHGEVNYNDKKTPLDADLHGLETDIRFDPGQQRYAGTIAYENGNLRYAQYSSLPHKVNLKFGATRDRFSLESAVLKVGESQILLHGTVSNYSTPVADGDYEIRVHTQDLASMVPSSQPAGDVLLVGQLHYQPAESKEFLRSISTQGQVASDALSAMESGIVVSLSKLQGRYQLSNGALRLSGVSLQALGGTITSEAEMAHLDTTPTSHIRASLHGISLRAAQQMLHRSELKSTAVSGALNGTAEASWRGSVSNLHAHADLAVQAAATSRVNPQGGEVPVNGAIHATYDGSRSLLTLNDSVVRIPTAVMTAQGTVSDHSNLQIQVSVTDLRQLVTLANSFEANSSAPTISGSASLSAVVRGSVRSPQVNGHLRAQDLDVQGSQWRSADLEFEAAPSHFAVQKANLVSAHQGQASLDAKVALRQWSYQPTLPMEANLSVRQLSVQDLQRLADQHLPVSGDLSAKMSVRGSQLDLQGSGSAQVVNARAYDEPIQTLAVRFDVANGAIASTLHITSRAGGLTADLSFTPKTKAYKVKLDAPAIVLEKLRTLQERNLSVSGTVSASANGEGSLENPQLTAVVQVPQLVAQQHSLGSLKAEVRMADRQADVNLDSSVSEVSVRGHARVQLTPGYYTDAAIDTTAIPLSLLMAAASQDVPEGFQGQTELHATVKGPLQDKSKVEAHLSIPTLTASYQSLQLGIVNPLHADYSNSLLTLQPVEFRGTGTSLHLQGAIPVGGDAAPNLTAQGSVDVRVLRLVVPDSRSSGLLAVDLRTSGSAAKPALQGQVQIKDVALGTDNAPIGIEKLNGTLNIDNERVQISNVTGEMGGGRVSVGGSIAYQPSLQFNVAVNGQSIRLRYPEGLRTLLEANLAFTGTAQASTLNGRVLIDSLNFSPEFDLAKFSDQFSNGTTTPSQPGFADTVNLQVIVQSKENLNATSSQVSIAGRADLQVIGTAANPVITGRTNLSSGELFYRGVRYQLQRGVITFDDPNETHAVMNVSVGTKVEQYNLTLNMRGPLDKLTTSYISDPPLPTADIINLIARGKTTQESAASSPSTDSMVASQAASQLSSRVQKLAGISSLQIDPLIGGNNQNPSARIAIQQRVTKNLFFTFSTDVSQPGSEIVQGDYQINKHWSASVTRDQLGGVSVDGKYRKRF